MEMQVLFSYFMPTGVAVLVLLLRLIELFSGAKRVQNVDINEVRLSAVG